MSGGFESTSELQAERMLRGDSQRSGKHFFDSVFFNIKNSKC